jgi:hypothetical protein
VRDCSSVNAEVLKLHIDALQRIKEALSALNSDRKPFRRYEYYSF